MTVAQILSNEQGGTQNFAHEGKPVFFAKEGITKDHSRSAKLWVPTTTFHKKIANIINLCCNSNNLGTAQIFYLQSMGLDTSSTDFLQEKPVTLRVKQKVDMANPGHYDQMQDAPTERNNQFFNRSMPSGNQRITTSPIFKMLSVHLMFISRQIPLKSILDALLYLNATTKFLYADSIFTALGDSEVLSAIRNTRKVIVFA
ncbi:hypothetical protein DAPPUDRAFT_118996 [Daphnia pulex]|uniref:Uncharacterized protein n=2 Tax=Daphnia pulex TaxID=6669 RepID=E9HX68_DAPPU|nr:hypothetical protein DAPPUDRAFT_118996 [Daphnia pulex]|eukprot:EFX63663.1 hypothetical protein DAPPUDRAFT_118996 [Daphnia pulex]